jgi:hypothetical protein
MVLSGLTRDDCCADIGRMTDRLPRYRILDAVPAENNVSRGFHRAGLVLAYPLIVVAIAIACTVIYNDGGLLRAGIVATLPLAAAGFVYAVCRGIGWIVKGFSRYS